jgi:hypothetical protein
MAKVAVEKSSSSALFNTGKKSTLNGMWPDNTEKASFLMMNNSTCNNINPIKTFR